MYTKRTQLIVKRQCSMRPYTTATLLFLLLLPSNLIADSLQVGTVCPVAHRQHSLGLLVFSKEWYHESRTNARYIPSDNATGIGIEIHFFSSNAGSIQHQNVAQCDRYRMLQIRQTNTKLDNNEQSLQIDVPEDFDTPFYDLAPMEYGEGTHLTPEDLTDKPWKSRPHRAATLSIYDTPYVTDYYGIEGNDIKVQFETCLVCQRQTQFDKILSCGQWGYERTYMAENQDWAEPEFTPVSCAVTPSSQLEQALQNSSQILYEYWLDWR